MCGKIDAIDDETAEITFGLASIQWSILAKEALHHDVKIHSDSLPTDSLFSCSGPNRIFGDMPSWEDILVVKIHQQYIQRQSLSAQHYYGSSPEKELHAAVFISA